MRQMMLLDESQTVGAGDRACLVNTWPISYIGFSAVLKNKGQGRICFTAAQRRPSNRRRSSRFTPYTLPIFPAQGEAPRPRRDFC